MGTRRRGTIISESRMFIELRDGKHDERNGGVMGYTVGASMLLYVINSNLSVSKYWFHVEGQKWSEIDT